MAPFQQHSAQVDKVLFIAKDIRERTVTIQELSLETRAGILECVSKIGGLRTLVMEVRGRRVGGEGARPASCSQLQGAACCSPASLPSHVDDFTGTALHAPPSRAAQA